MAMCTMRFEWDRKLNDADGERVYAAGWRSILLRWSACSSCVAGADRPRLLIAAVSSGPPSRAQSHVVSVDARTT